MITAILLVSNAKYFAKLTTTLLRVDDLGQVVYCAKKRNADIESVVPENTQFIEQQPIGSGDADAVTVIAKLYQEALKLATGDKILFLEQDVEPLGGAIATIARQLNDFTPPYAAVSAIYDNGSGHGFSNVHASFLSSTSGAALSAIPMEVEAGYCLVGCTVFDAETVKKAFDTKIPKLCSYVPWESWLGARFHDLNRPWLARGDAKCLHKGLQP